MTETPRSHAFSEPPRFRPLGLPHDVIFPDPRLEEAWLAGEYTRSTTEPWTMQLLASLIVALGAKNVLETGTSMGLSTLWLADTMKMVGGRLTTVDADPHATAYARDFIGDDFPITFVTSEATSFLAAYEGPKFDFVFLDDLHTTEHVLEELRLLRPIASGIVAVHDLFNTPGLAAALEGDAFFVDTRRIHIGHGLALMTLR